MLSNVKEESRDSYTCLTKTISDEKMESNSCRQSPFLSFTFSDLCDITEEKTGWHMVLGKMSFIYKNTTQGSFYFSVSQFITTYFLFVYCLCSFSVCFLLRRHMELKNLAGQLYSTSPQININTRLSTADCRGQRW